MCMEYGIIVNLYNTHLPFFSLLGSTHVAKKIIPSSNFTRLLPAVAIIIPSAPLKFKQNITAVRNFFYY